MTHYNSVGVTAVYDIGRVKIDGRTITDYKEYLLKTLKLDIPFVVFLDQSLESWEKEILSVRNSVGPVHIIKTHLSDIPFWKYRSQVLDIMKNSKFMQTIRYKQDITYNLPEYCLIQYSKFGWIKHVKDSGYFSAENYVWLDAGASRFFIGDRSYKHQDVIPNSLFSINREHLLNGLTADTYIGTNECIIHGTIFSINKSLVNTFHDSIIFIWENEMLAKGRFDNEQIALVLMYISNPDIFTMVRNDGRYLTHCGAIISKLFGI